MNLDIISSRRWWRRIVDWHNRYVRAPPCSKATASAPVPTLSPQGEGLCSGASHPAPFTYGAFLSPSGRPATRGNRGIRIPAAANAGIRSRRAPAVWRAAAQNFPTSDLTFPAAEIVFPVRLQVQETAQEVRVELAADVLFDFDKAAIRPDAAAVLTETAQLIREKSHGPVRVEGHTDGKGSDAYNQKLSERRAQAVASWLVSQGGLKGMAFRTAGMGARQPVAPNTKPDGTDNPEGRQQNRRVSLVIQK